MPSKTPERRQNSRIPMTLECAITVASQVPRRCTTRDVSQEGAFVAGETNGLAPDSAVTLAVQLTMDGRTQVQEFHAIVRHLAAAGVGLQVADARPLLRAALAKRAQNDEPGAV